MIPISDFEAINWKNDNGVTIFLHNVIVHFFDVVSFLLSSVVTHTSFISISWLVLYLWQFSFIRDWREIWKLEIPPSEVCPISRLGQVRDTKSSRNVSNGPKCQGYSLMKLSPPPSHPLLSPSPPKIRLRYDVLFFDNILENLEIVAKKTMYYSRGIIWAHQL